MIQTLLNANSFAEAFVQGVIKGIFMLIFFLAFSAIIKIVKRNNKANQPDLISSNTIVAGEDENKMTNKSSNQKAVEKNQLQSASKKAYDYFFANNLNKGYRRLLIVGSFILPFGLALILYYSSAVEGTNSYDEVYVYYDDSTLLTGFVLGYILYWTIFCVTIWVIKGFREEKRV